MYIPYVWKQKQGEHTETNDVLVYQQHMAVRAGNMHHWQELDYNIFLIDLGFIS